MKDKIFGVLQRVGRSFMLPIAILPVAGLLLGFGGSFTNATMIQAYHLEALLGEGTLLNGFLNILNSCGNVVFENLPLLFAIGVAVGMAKQEKEVAALASVIAFFIMPFWCFPEAWSAFRQFLTEPGRRFPVWLVRQSRLSICWTVR